MKQSNFELKNWDSATAQQRVSGLAPPHINYLRSDAYGSRLSFNSGNIYGIVQLPTEHMQTTSLGYNLEN